MGLETAFPVLYTGLVLTGVISLEKLVKLLSTNPRRRFRIPISGEDCCVWDLNAKYRIDPASFRSMGRATPFAGMEVFGRCVKTVYNGETVYIEK